MRITPAEFFVPRWTCLWATSYQFEPQLFEQFLFRRLGDPPLNVTLLLDADELAETWTMTRSIAGGGTFGRRHDGSWGLAAGRCS